MKNVNVAELKNKLSSYLDEVDLGEEFLVMNRNRAVARLVPVHGAGEDDEEKELLKSGVLRPAETEITRPFLKKFLAARKPRIGKATSVEALVSDRHED